MKKRDDTTKDETINRSAPCIEEINHNGFTNAPPLTQLIPPIIGILSLGLTLVSINSLFESRLALIACNLGLAIDFGLTMWLWYLATSIIPTDGLQLRYLAALQKGQDFDQTNLPFYCHSCKSYISSNCFHCKRCRRCVQFFDHHCKWLNNCIGAKNYFEFYGLIITTFVMFSLCISLSCYCLSHIDVDSDDDKWVLSCSITTILVGSVPCCWLLYLFCLHTYLIFSKKSTMQLIMQTRTKNKVTPSEEDNKNKIFKVSFTKNQTDSEVVKKVMFQGGKEEELSNSETNNNLIVMREKEDLPEPGQISTNVNSKSLPPLKTKMTFSFYEKSDGKAIPMTLTPHLISRS